MNESILSNAFTRNQAVREKILATKSIKTVGDAMTKLMIGVSFL